MFDINICECSYTYINGKGYWGNNIHLNNNQVWIDGVLQPVFSNLSPQKICTIAILLTFFYALKIYWPTIKKMYNYIKTGKLSSSSEDEFFMHDCNGNKIIKGKGGVIRMNWSNDDPLSPFDAISCVAGTVNIEPNNSQDSISLWGQENILENLNVCIQDKTLYIELPKGITLAEHIPLVFRVGLVNQHHIHLSGQASYNFTQAVTGDFFKLTATGQSSVDQFILNTKEGIIFGVDQTKINSSTSNQLKKCTLHFSGQSSGTFNALNCNSITSKVSGQSSLSLSGTTNNLSLDASGQSSYQGKSLHSSTASVCTSGQSHVYVNTNNFTNHQSTGQSSMKNYR
jgi:hypothetical protein